MSALVPLAILGALMFSAACYLWTVFRSFSGESKRVGVLDCVARVGIWLHPFTWFIYLVVYPLTGLADRMNRRDMGR